jgi:hypothetical protein
MMRATLLVDSRDLGDAHVHVLLNRSAAEQTIDIPVEPRDADSAMIDWYDPDETIIRSSPSNVSDGRPDIEAVAGAGPAVVSRGNATVSLKPWRTMILAPAQAKWSNL